MKHILIAAALVTAMLLAPLLWRLEPVLHLD